MPRREVDQRLNSPLAGVSSSFTHRMAWTGEPTTRVSPRADAVTVTRYDAALHACAIRLGNLDKRRLEM